MYVYSVSCGSVSAYVHICVCKIVSSNFNSDLEIWINVTLPFYSFHGMILILSIIQVG